MQSSDAQQVTGSTNATGKLRLAKAGHRIDHRRFFRYDLFGNQNWNVINRNGNNYDVATVPFNVTIRGNAMGPMQLNIDHAPHREAGQNNVPTVLAWGPINAILGATSHVGDWVAIERDTAGNFTLTIQQQKPSWAP